MHVVGLGDRQRCLMRARGALVIDKGIGKAQELQGSAEASRAPSRRQIANLRKLASLGREPHLKTLRSYEKDSFAARGNR